MGGPDWEETLAPEWRVLNPPKATLLDLTLQRMDGEESWRWQSQVFFDRLFKAHPGEILNVLGVPKVWPVGVPLRLRLNPGYASRHGGNQATVRVRQHAAGVDWTGSGDSQNSIFLDPGCIGPVDAGTNTTKLDVELWAPYGLVWRGLITPRLKVGGTIEDYVKGVEPADIEAQIVGRHPRISFTDEGELYFMLDNDLREGDRLSCTLAVDVELIRNGKPVGRASLYRFNIRALMEYAGSWTPYLSSAIEWSDPDARHALDQARWEARLTPNASLAMLDYVAEPRRGSFNQNVNTYWKGNLVVPVKIERFDSSADPYLIK